MYPIRVAKKYDPNNLKSTSHLYTTVYLGTYISDDFLEGNGSHPGVDMIPQTSGADVYAVLDGVVVTAGENGTSGKHVVIRHDRAPDPDDLSQTEALYSSYLHLSQITTETGAIVTEGTRIGATGTTGISTGEHLHFQIDRESAPYHPYWPYSTAEASAAGYGFLEAVNAGLGLEKAKTYTINPLVYLDAVEAHHSTHLADSATDTDVHIAADARSDSTTFPDVPESHPYATAVYALRDRGVVSGNGGMFYPENNVSRAELVKMVFNAGDIPIEGEGLHLFHDVPDDAWYTPYVNTAKLRGVVLGYDDGTFRPNNPVTRVE